MRTLIIILIILIYSCSPRQSNETTRSMPAVFQPSDGLLTKDSLWLSQLFLHSNDTKSGYTVTYEDFSAKYFKVKWGRQNDLRTFPDSFPSLCADNRIPTFDKETSNFIVLKYGCGSECWGAIVLPKDKNLKGRDIMYPIQVDTAKDILVFCDYKSKGLTIELLNLNTNKKKTINLTENCDNNFPLSFLDSSAIEKDFLFLKWRNSLDSKADVTSTRVMADF
jgi:hypothetical protein